MERSEEEIRAEQREFFRRNRAGCAFAAHAAKNMDRYGWRQEISEVSSEAIDRYIATSIQAHEVTTLSLLFPHVRDNAALFELIAELRRCELVFLEERAIWERWALFRFRARVGSAISWITGFGPFGYFPKTRQSPSTEITIRVKPRPDYEWHFKQYPPVLIHLADMDMRGLSKLNLFRLWNSSFARTKQVLGHAPDEASAAKTTFAVPLDCLPDISE